MLLRKTLRLFFAVLFRLFSKVEVYGFENIPIRGGGIIAPNHLGFMDAPLLFVLVRREDFTALVAKKHRKNLMLRFIVNTANGIWINRDVADSQAVRAARSHLQEGGLLGLAPEGTRSKTGGLVSAKTGVAYLAEKTGTPIYPVAISGTYRGFHKLLRFKRPHITIQFGEPFHPEPLEKGKRDASLQRNTDEIMVRIAKMLPAEYRGVYANHPRLLELVAGKENFNKGTALRESSVTAGQPKNNNSAS